MQDLKHKLCIIHLDSAHADDSHLIPTSHVKRKEYTIRSSPDLATKMSKPRTKRARASEVDVARNDPPQFAKVVWYKEPHLRKLYAMSLVLMIASSTTGYDGSLINTSQQIQLWRDFFGDAIADNNKLGILVNMFNIGSIVSFFFTPYVADHFGRRIAIIVGCIFMVCGGCMTAFCDGYTSMSFCISSTSSMKDGFELTIC